MDIRDGVLSGLSYPAMSSPNDLMRNAQTIHTILRKYEGNIWLVGTGTSGAVIITSIMVTGQGRYEHLLLKKPSESTHRIEAETVNGGYPIDGDILVIVDDLVHSGKTLDNMRHILTGRGWLHLVKVVAIPDTPNRMFRHFPNLELVIR